MGTVIGWDFSGGSTKLPLAVAALALGANCDDLGDAAGEGCAAALTAGVGVAAGGGVVGGEVEGVWAFAEQTKPPSATRKLPRRMRNFKL